MEFSEVLSSLRKESGRSQRKAAADLDISQALLSHYEKGIREPRLEFVVRACEYYGVSADYLLGRTGIKENPVLYLKTGGGIWENKKVRSFTVSVLLLINIAADAAGTNAAAAISTYMGYLAYKLIRIMGIAECAWPETIAQMPDAVFSARCDAAMKLAEAEIAMEMTGEKDLPGKFASAEEKMKKNFPDLFRALSEFAEMTGTGF